MNVLEHLLTCVAEESDEIVEAGLRISKAAHKALRFRLDDLNPDTDRTNRADLVKETNDLLGALKKLQEAGIELPGLFSEAAIEAKKAKITKWMNHAERAGTLSCQREIDPPNRDPNFFLLRLADLCDEFDASFSYASEDDGVHIAIDGQKIFVGHLDTNLGVSLRSVLGNSG